MVVGGCIGRAADFVTLAQNTSQTSAYLPVDTVKHIMEAMFEVRVPSADGGI